VTSHARFVRGLPEVPLLAFPPPSRPRRPAEENPRRKERADQSRKTAVPKSSACWNIMWAITPRYSYKYPCREDNLRLTFLSKMAAALLLRETNLDIADRAHADSLHEARFLCECGAPGCLEPVVLGLGEFQKLIERPDARVLASGHLSKALVLGTEPSASTI
jgi:hypothetical protein